MRVLNCSTASILSLAWAASVFCAFQTRGKESGERCWVYTKLQLHIRALTDCFAMDVLYVLLILILLGDAGFLLCDVLSGNRFVCMISVVVGASLWVAYSLFAAAVSYEVSALALFFCWDSVLRWPDGPVRWFSASGILPICGVVVRHLLRRPSRNRPFAALIPSVKNSVVFVADTGDAQHGTRQLLEWIARRRENLILGGDLAYPLLSRGRVHSRFIRCLPALVQLAGQQVLDCFAVPGNHDMYDKGRTFEQYFCATAGGYRRFLWFNMQQPEPFFAFRLVDGSGVVAAVVLGLTFGSLNRQDISEAEGRYFAHVADTLDEQAKVIICMHRPFWLLDTVAELQAAHCTRFLSLMRRFQRHCIAVVAGDLHIFHSTTGTQLPSYVRARLIKNRTKAIVCGTGGAFLHPTHRHTIASTAPAVPHAGLSRRLARDLVWKFPLCQPGFVGLMAVLLLPRSYLLLCICAVVVACVFKYQAVVGTWLQATWVTIGMFAVFVAGLRLESVWPSMPTVLPALAGASVLGILLGNFSDSRAVEAAFGGAAITNALACLRIQASQSGLTFIQENIGASSSCVI